MKTSIFRILRRILLVLIPLVVTYHALAFYGFISDPVLGALLFVAFVAYLCMDWKNALLLSVALLGATILVNAMLWFAKVEDRIYYRDHERFTVYNSDLQGHSYRKNLNVTLQQPFGDVRAVGGEGKVEEEPRTVRFQTDSLGFRNSRNYRGQKYVLVGDSFTVGNGITQEDILASQLKEKYGIDAYTLAYPGGIPEYVKYILYFERTYKTDFKVLLFLFEGNDFEDAFSRRQFATRSRVDAFFKGYRSFFDETILYRYTYSLAARLKKKPFTPRVFTIQGHKLGEFSEYAGVTERSSYTFPEKAIPALSRVRDRIEHIYFIPTKYRVYYPFFNDVTAKPLPNAQWEAAKTLSDRLNIPCTDLTGPLIAESSELLKKGEFTYWKDDSHWNKRGIAVAAKVVADQIRAGK